MYSIKSGSSLNIEGAKTIMEKIKKLKIKAPYKARRKADKIKDLLDKYKFSPDFVPSTKELLSDKSSIHELKIKRLNAKRRS